MHSYLFGSIVILCLGIATWLFLSGSEKMEAGDVWQLRVSQLRDVQINPDQEIHPLLMMGDLPASGYFSETSTGLIYQGGLYGQPWEVGEAYSEDEIRSIKPAKIQNTPFFWQSLEKNRFYINIDRGDDEAVRDFLKVMDQRESGESDTLIIDFRFLRTIDFSSMIRLFNQIAPRYKITFGKVINAHQEEIIKSTGQPFFTMKYTVFLVDPCIPAPVNRLIMSLTSDPSYDFIGSLGEVSDTVCLYTGYTIGPETYRICTEKWTGDPLRPENATSGQLISDSLRLDWIIKMDEVWYKNQDSSGTEKLIQVMLDQLLP